MHLSPFNSSVIFSPDPTAVDFSVYSSLRVENYSEQHQQPQMYSLVEDFAAPNKHYQNNEDIMSAKFKQYGPKLFAPDSEQSFNLILSQRCVKSLKFQALNFASPLQAVL